MNSPMSMSTIPFITFLCRQICPFLELSPHLLISSCILEATNGFIYPYVLSKKRVFYDDLLAYSKNPADSVSREECMRPCCRFRRVPYARKLSLEFKEIQCFQLYSHKTRKRDSKGTSAFLYVESSLCSPPAFIAR